MLHTFYVLFDGADAAVAAIQDLERLGTPRKHCNVILHRDSLPVEELHIGESQIRRGALRGGVTTGLVGALLGGLILGPLGLVGAGAGAAALFAGLAGAAYGTAMGAIAGASSPDQHLEELAGELGTGKVLLTVETPGLTLEEDAAAVVSRHGGHIAHPAIV